VTSCCVPQCTYRVSKYSNISFHEFPHSNPQLLEQWLRRIKRKNFKPARHVSFVCSEHFLESDFKADLTSRKKKEDKDRRTRKRRILKKTLHPQFLKVTHLT